MACRIALLITELDEGGAERIVYDLARSLDPARWSPLVIALDGRGPYASRLRDAGLKVRDLQAYRRRDWPVVWRLRRVLAVEGVKLLHTHLVHANIVGRLAARPLRIPVVATSHIVERRPVAWHFWLDRLTARWCEAEVCVSEAVKRHQQQQTHLPDTFFRVIPNGIDLARFHHLPTRAEARKQLHLPEHGLLVGAMGRLDRQKGFDLFLEALGDPALGDFETLAVIAGAGPEEGALRERARRLRLLPDQPASRQDPGASTTIRLARERLRFLGHVDRPEVFLAALDLCVMPSRWEGFGLVAVEAMAAGTPILASAVDSLPELITDGSEGRLVPPEEPTALAEAIVSLLSDAGERRRMEHACAARASSFSLAAMVAHYERVYQELLDRPFDRGQA